MSRFGLISSEIWSSPSLEPEPEPEMSEAEKAAIGLPSGWETQVSRTHGDVYYVNIHTGESQYERPTEDAPEKAPETPRSINSHDDGDDVVEAADGWEASKKALAAAGAAAAAAVAQCAFASNLTVHHPDRF